MKLAVIGSGPAALETALHFHQLGASVTLFYADQIGGNVVRLNKVAPQSIVGKAIEKTSELGRSLVTQALSDLLTAEDYLAKYLIPISQYLEQEGILKKGRVLRVHKRFLQLNEEINGRSRLHDLFRVIYTVNPEEAILQQLKDNPEVFAKLGEDVVASLHEPVESFEDFDLIIDATGKMHKAFAMGASHAEALNEKNLKKQNKIFYGKQVLDHWQEVVNAKQLVIVGDGDSSAFVLTELGSHILSRHLKVRLVTHQTRPFNEIQNEFVKKEVWSLLDSVEKLYAQACMDYQTKLHAWRDLPDFERVKIQAPELPESPLEIYTGMTVTSIDRLVDREGLFVTIESSHFREGVEADQLKTLPADVVLVLNGYDVQNDILRPLRASYTIDRKAVVNQQGVHPEAGLYTVFGQPNLSEKLQAIEANILSFFKKA